MPNDPKMWCRAQHGAWASRSRCWACLFAFVSAIALGKDAHPTVHSSTCKSFTNFIVIRKGEIRDESRFHFQS